MEHPDAAFTHGGCDKSKQLLGTPEQLLYSTTGTQSALCQQTKFNAASAVLSADISAIYTPISAAQTFQRSVIDRLNSLNKSKQDWFNWSTLVKAIE